MTCIKTYSKVTQILDGFQKRLQYFDFNCLMADRKRISFEKLHDIDGDDDDREGISDR